MLNDVILAEMELEGQIFLDEGTERASDDAMEAVVCRIRYSRRNLDC